MAHSQLTMPPIVAFMRCRGELSENLVPEWAAERDRHLLSPPSSRAKSQHRPAACHVAGSHGDVLSIQAVFKH